MPELQSLEAVTCMVSDLPALWESLLAYGILAQGAALEVGGVGYKATAGTTIRGDAVIISGGGMISATAGTINRVSVLPVLGGRTR